MIMVWNGFIVDGHNRYEICTKHNIKYLHNEMSFEDRFDAKLWIIRNQLDRRNLSDFAKSELALKHKDIIVAKAEERKLQSLKQNSEVQISTPRSSDEEKGKTRDAVAKLAGV